MKSRFSSVILPALPLNGLQKIHEGLFSTFDHRVMNSVLPLPFTSKNICLTSVHLKQRSHVVCWLTSFVIIIRPGKGQWRCIRSSFCRPSLSEMFPPSLPLAIKHIFSSSVWGGGETFHLVFHSLLPPTPTAFLFPPSSTKKRSSFGPSTSSREHRDSSWLWVARERETISDAYLLLCVKL